MTKEQKKTDFTEKNIYVGIDVHLKSWAISLHYEKQQIRYFQQPPNTKSLLGMQKSMFGTKSPSHLGEGLG